MASMIDGKPAAPVEDTGDLGFGSRVSQSEQRLLNRDGSFNVRRTGLPFLRTLNPYHALLTMSWARFYGLLVGLYLLTNLGFATGYVLCGEGALRGAEDTPFGRFGDAFFFSVQTLATIGYGHISPRGWAANTLVAIEALLSLLGVAFAASISFARFTRPQANILFSRQATIAPYRGITGFQFRIVNERSNQLLQLEAQVVFTRMVTQQGRRIRQYDALPLERKRVMFFPLHWTIVHPIDTASPLHGLTHQDLVAAEAEFLILLTGVDETFSQTVHARASYRAEELAVGARFRDMFARDAEGQLSVDLSRLHDLEPVP